MEDIAYHFGGANRGSINDRSDIEKLMFMLWYMNTDMNNKQKRKLKETFDQYCIDLDVLIKGWDIYQFAKEEKI